MQKRIKNILLYALICIFQPLFSCSFPSSQYPPTPDSSAAEIEQEVEQLLIEMELLHAQVFELESYMDTARDNIHNGLTWEEEHGQIKMKYDALQLQHRVYADHLEILLSKLKVPSENVRGSEPL
jgi:hypothetical protein